MVAAVLVALSSLGLIRVGTANAHDQLLATTPLDGAVLASAPHSLTLTFAQEPLPGTTHVVAHTNTGELVQLPEPVIAGRVITVRWPTDRVAGTYEASWRLTSPDGHPVSGSWTFTYGLSKAQPISRETTQGERAASGPVVLVVVSIVAVALLVVAVWIAAVKRRRRPEG